MLTKDTFNTTTFISLFFPSFYRIQGQHSLPQKDNSAYHQFIANEAKAFFVRLNSEIKAFNESKTPLPDFQCKKDLRLHHTIEQLSYLQKDQKIYEETQEFAEDTLIELITAESSSIRHRNENQQTPLHLIALYSTHKVLQHLLTQLRVSFSSQADQNFEKNFINAQDKEGRTALHFAASRQQEDTAKLLLINHADANVFDFYDHVPLHYAAESYVPWIKLLYDSTDSENSSIWIQALKKPLPHQKYTKKTLMKVPCNHLNSKYCLLSGSVIEHYYPPLKDNSIPTLLAKGNDIAKYVMIAIPPLFNQMLEKETYRNVLKNLLTEDIEGQFACLALDNPRFMEELLKEDDLAQLTALSNRYPRFALQIFRNYLDHIKQHKQYLTYFESLKENYHAAEPTYDALCQTIASKLALFEINNLVGGNKWDSRNTQDYKRLFRKLVSSFLDKLKGEQEDTPLHIAAKRGASEFIEEILTVKGAEKWYNKPNKEGKSPFDLAVEADIPNTKAIELLYHHADKKTLKRYLPTLESSFITDQIETVQECIEDFPYYLTNVLVHSKARKQYTILRDISNNLTKDNQPTSFLEAFSEDPLAMLVGVTCPTFKKQMQTILMDPHQSQRIFELAYQYKENLGIFNTEKIVLPIIKQSLALKNNLEEKKTFFHNIFNTYAICMPYVALYTLKKFHKDLITEDLLETILYHYTPRYRVELLEMKRHDLNKNLVDEYTELAIKTITAYISERDAQLQIDSKRRQLLKIPSEQITNYLNDSDKAGNTILHNTLLTSHPVDIDNRSSSGKPNTQSDLYYQERLNNFLELFRKTKETIKSKRGYTNHKLDNFLHIAASRGTTALSIITECFNQPDLKDLLKEFCEGENCQRKTPLKIALETKNIGMIELLEKYTTNITFWQDACKVAIERRNVETIQTQLNTQFDGLKSGYRLLNHSYRNAFKKCIAIIKSAEHWKTKAQEVATIGKENIYALYAIIDYPVFFEYLLVCSQHCIIDVFTQHKAGSISGQKALSEALQNKEFCNRLSSLPHCTKTIQLLSEKYKIFSIGQEERTFSFDSLIQALRAKLHENLQPPAPNIGDNRPSL